MNRAFHIHGDEMDMHECLSRTFFSSSCRIEFYLSFPLFARYKKKQTRIFIRHNPFTGYFFSLFFGGFFPDSLEKRRKEKCRKTKMSTESFPQFEAGEVKSWHVLI